MVMSPPWGHRVSLCGRGPRTLVSAKETSSNEGLQPHSRGSEKPTALSARKTRRRERLHVSQALTQCQFLSSHLPFKKGLAGNSGEPLSGFFWGFTILSTIETCARSFRGLYRHSIIRLLAQGRCCRQVAAPGESPLLGSSLCGVSTPWDGTRRGPERPLGGGRCCP